MNTQIKPLDKLTLTELFELYGRTVWLQAQCDPGQRRYREIEAERKNIESEARRRDQLTWMPAQAKRGEDWDLYA